MVVLTVIAVWLVLCLVTAGLFVAVIRGGGGTEAAEAETEATTPQPVAVPGQRAAEVPVPATPAR